MSFSSTPLGHGRRLPQSSFLGKPNSAGNRPPSPVSYSYGAPPLGSRSPPKPTSPSRDRTTASLPDEDENEPALARFARLKQREQAEAQQLASSRPGGPKIITSPPKPDQWSHKDTSVNIASAFYNAVANTSNMSDPNSSWYNSSTSRAKQNIHRSTSVEYENHATAAAAKRLAPPPNKLGARPPVSGAGRKPPSKALSREHVPDSEGEDEPNNSMNRRGKSPFEHIVDYASKVIGPAVYYARAPSHEPENRSGNNNTNGNDTSHESSYGYEAEERMVQEMQQEEQASSSALLRRGGHKKGRISTDNKAYKPSVSDQESDEDFEDDDGKPRRRKKKGRKEPFGGPLTTLPVVSASKAKKRRAKGSKSHINIGGQEEEESDSEEQTVNDSFSQTATQRTSIPPPFRYPAPRDRSAPLEPPSFTNDSSIDSAEQGLNSIPEVDEEHLFDLEKEKAHAASLLASQKRQTTPRRNAPSAFSIGAILGTLVNRSVKLCLWVFSLFGQLLTLILFLCGKVVGTVYDIVFLRPFKWAQSVGAGIPKNSIGVAGKYLVASVVLLAAWWVVSQAGSSAIPSLPIPSLSWSSSTPTKYKAPEVPAANIAEFSERLLALENALSGLSLDTETARAKADGAVKGVKDLLDHFGNLEGTVRNIGDVRKEVGGVKREVEVLQAQIRVKEREAREREREREREDNASKGSVSIPVVEEEWLKALEERVGSVEGGVKEALEASKKAASNVVAPASGPITGATAAWWNKLASSSAGSAGLTIKSTDGQNITALIEHLVDSAVGILKKDDIAKPDFAHHSGGARVIPSLTSDTVEIKPATLRGRMVGYVTGHGYAIARPPVTALHHDSNIGYCWPFKGSQGHLGVALSAPIYPEEFTIDHLAREVAFDLRSAPRQMEVWGMVEGKDNIAKVKAWQEERAARREAAAEFGLPVSPGDDDVPYPSFLPKSPPYLRLANFTYDINAGKSVQTFPVFPEIHALNADFGIVILRVLNNWGLDERTCLYRFRAHGKPYGDLPPPFSEDINDLS